MIRNIVNGLQFNYLESMNWATLPNIKVISNGKKAKEVGQKDKTKWKNKESHGKNTYFLSL